VLAFEAAFSLPAGTRTLAELGAEVVRVSRPARVSGNYITIVDGGGLSKPSLALDLKHEQARTLARRLAARADAVCNNFRPSVMKRYGLDYTALRAVKPDIIVLQMSGYGTPGPWQDFPAYGPSVEAAGGMNALIGRPDDPPVRVGSGVFADQVGGRYAALALIAALEHRRRTGDGQYIDLSMAEGITHLLGDKILSAARTGRLPERRGNRDALIAPQGVYPCKDEGGRTRSARDGDEVAERDTTHPSDSWVALSVRTDAEWRALRDLLDDPMLCDPALECVEARRRAHDAIDAAIAAWTRRHTKDAAAALLQERGIPAGPAQKTSDLPLDPHLAARGAFSLVRHQRPILGHGAHPHLTTPWQATGLARHQLTDIRDDGQDSARILKRWLGLPPREVARLQECGALLPPTPLLVQEPPVPANTPVDPEFGARLGLDLTPRPPSLRGKGVPHSTAVAEVSPFPRREGGRGVR
jgi:crotonobetainyl-CoA:carnitine CoA-transferase CaiB-like acyl-CoA transferase